MSFQAVYQPLEASHPNQGSIAVLPWDSKTFGFNVAEIRPGVDHPPHALKTLLAEWTNKEKVRLVSAAIPCHQADWLQALQEVGFRLIDTVVIMGFKHLQKAQLVSSPAPVREAEADDLEKLKQIALTGFRVGRYHADLQFPRDLANRRYEGWVENCFDNPLPGTLILVADHEGEPVGFTISVFQGEEATCQLTCVHPDFQNNLIGYALSVEQTHALKARGVQRTRSRLSVQSVPAIQTNEHLGNSVLGTEYILHWHVRAAE